MPITVVAKLKVKAGGEEKFRAEANKMIEHVTRNEPDTLAYILHSAQGDATQFMFYEVYADQAALATHGGSDPMKQFFGSIRELLDGRPEIAMYEELGGKR